MKKIWKKTLALLLVVVMIGGAAPLGALTLRASAKTIGEYRQGDLVEFGWYPQTEVKDAELVAALDAAGGAWQSYGYYIGTGYEDGQMTAKDYMQYCDVTVGGQKYRGVTFSQYRPCVTGYTSDVNLQESNGYYTGVTYWFRYEPLYWRLLDPATGLVLCLTVIDSQPYNNFILSFGYDKYNNSAYWGDAGKTHFANNYAESSLRQWLNDDFYNTAFTAEQQNVIVATTLDNSAFRTDYSAYDSATTTDKVFLLSYSDMTNTAYGFNTDNWTDDPARQAESSDYAECQGVLVNSNNYSRWWLRSAGEVSCLARYVNFDGWVPDNCDVIFTYIGIRPALKLNLSSVTVEHTAAFMVDGVCVQETKQEEGAAIVKPADPVKEGYTFTGWSPAVPATMPAYDLTFTAQFSKNSYTVTWKLDGNTTTNTVAYGDAIVKPADPVKEGYTFTGWSPEVPATMPAQDMTFTAQFQKNETPPAGKVRSVTADSLTLIYKKDGSLQPAVTADEGVQYTVAYSGFDNKIISIDANGKVTALKKGSTTVTVTATDENGNTEECTCKVTVQYAWWQWLIIIPLFGWIWY